MRTCKWCGKSGWLLSLSKDGLCQKCESEVRMRVVHTTRMLNECLMLMRRAGEVDARIAKGQQAIGQLQELLPYYEKGLVELKPSPQEWVARIFHAERTIVNNHIQRMIDDVKTNEQKSSSKESRVQVLNNVLDTVERYKSQLGAAKTTEWKKRIEGYMGKIILKKAESDVEHGRRERAIDQYLEALDILRADDTGDPEQTNRIEKIKSRIKELGGEVPVKWDSSQGGDGLPSSVGKK